ncbi:MAG: SigB/SigF/SigG family RNA polymerase sigma factor [Clostridia bacterium]|nr:SigB/SigF/SigG family RNA polymerase sigma factor [Clostridia bacterium]
MRNNQTLLRQIKDGDEAALEELINENMGLIKSVTLRFLGRGAETEDLIQIGAIGMIKAARSFDFSYNTEFSTYAVPLIIGEIRRFLRDDGQIKVSRSIKRQGVAVMRKSEELTRTLGREPTVGELARECEMSPEEVTYVLEAVSPVHSLHEAVGGDNTLTLESVISDKENAIERLTDRIALGEAIATLDETSRKILHLRYIKELSQQQTGNILGLSQVKVSREEKKIMQKLKQAL